MDLPEQQPENQTQTKNSGQFGGLAEKTAWTVLILSLIGGVCGGILGFGLALKTSVGQKLLRATEVSRQKISLNEDSAIIDVVKQASPAVVSIVISKDLNKIPGYGFNPNGNDSYFWQWFYGRIGQPSGQNSATPNVQQIGAGSGFFVSADGLILTNKHVVEDQQASYTVITSAGQKYAAKVLASDSGNDLALLKIDVKNAAFLSFADSSGLQTGQRVVAIGNSLGQYQNTVTSGIISGIGRSVSAGDDSGSEQLSGVIQTDAAINPGNSGGPLLNMLGQVVGINTAIDQQGQLVGFAIPSNDAQKALASFQKTGKISRPFLGVRYLMITPDLAKEQNLPKDYGALILRGSSLTDLAVVPGSPADKAGLMENDIILEAGGTKVDGDNTLSQILKDYSVGDTVSLKVYHKGSEQNMKVTLGESK